MPASTRFSVVIPAYNAQDFVVQALDSVRAQTYTRYQVILVNDGSTDRTAELAAEWGRAQPRFPLRIHAQANRGIGAARNAGIQVSHEPWLAFLDVDDLWEPQKLEMVAEYLGRSPDAGLVCHDEWREGPDGRRRLSRYGPYTRYADLLFKRNTISTSATVVRTDAVRAVGGFSENLSINGLEDYDLWLRLARSGTVIRYLHQPLGTYRVYGGGITSNVESYCQRGLNLLRMHYTSWQPKTPYSDWRVRLRRAGMLRSAGRALMQQGHRGAALRYASNAFAVAPFSWRTWGVLGACVMGVKL